MKQHVAMMKQGLRQRSALLLAFLCATPPPRVWAADPPAEYKVKAECLFNFTKFVEWPDGAFASAGAPVEIGVWGDNPFGDALAEVVKDEIVHGRGIEVRKATRNVEELKSCHVVFVSRSEQTNVAKRLVALSGSHALVVGDAPGFAERGGIINFYLQGTKVRFEINVKAAQKKGLKISAQLLGLAKIVGKSE